MPEKEPSSLREYQDMCKATAKKFDSKEKEILTWGLGIAGEAGDVASCIKKTFAHDNDQRAGIRENIGDSLWYAAFICNFFDWDMQEVLDENIEKLKKLQIIAAYHKESPMFSLIPALWSLS